MKIYYLFRHGETYFSKNEVPYGENELTASILPESTYAIENIAHTLKDVSIQKAFRSELKRCQETAGIIEKTVSFSFEPNALFNEFMEDKFDDFSNRMNKLTTFLEGLPDQNIAICTHGAVIAALKRLLLKKDFTAHHLMYYPKTGVIVKMTGDRIEEIDCN